MGAIFPSPLTPLPRIGVERTPADPAISSSPTAWEKELEGEGVTPHPFSTTDRVA